MGGIYGHCSHGLGRATCAYCRDPSARDSNKGLGVVKRSRTLLSQFFAKLDPNPNSRVDAWIQFLALIAACAVVIYCVKRHNASADADAIANPTLFKRLLNA